MFKNLSVAKKIGGSFGVVLVLLAVVAFWSNRGIGRIAHNTERISALQQLNAEMRQREIDHLGWANQVSGVLLDESATALSVQMDPHQCAFGKWYYGADRQAAEHLLPEIATTLAEIEGPHNSLHQSASEIATALGQANGHARAIKVYETTTKIELGKVRQQLGSLVEQATSTAEAEAQQMRTETSRARMGVLILSLTALVIGVVVAVVLVRGILSALKRAIGALAEGSEQVSASSEQVASASQQVASGASEQAASLD